MDWAKRPNSSLRLDLVLLAMARLDKVLTLFTRRCSLREITREAIELRNNANTSAKKAATKSKVEQRSVADVYSWDIDGNGALDGSLRIDWLESGFVDSMLHSKV